MEKTTPKFNLRAFAALVIAFCLIGLTATGIANHIYGFEPLTVPRHAWMSAHNVLALLFVVFAVWHIFLNRQVLWNHLTRAVARAPAVSREAILAGTVVALLLVVFVGHAFHVGR